MKRKRKRKPEEKEQKKLINRKNGYYWLQVRRPNGTIQWIIAKWWYSLQFFDTMGTIMEIGRRDKIIGIDENPINHIEKPKKVKRKRLR